MKEFRIGERVKRIEDGCIQTIYDIDEISNTLKVNWLGPHNEMHREEHKIVGDKQEWPVVKTVC